MDGKFNKSKRHEKDVGFWCDGLSMELLDILMRDRTTGGYIRWVTSEYGELGKQFACDAEMTPKVMLQCYSNLNHDILPRAFKPVAKQHARKLLYRESFRPTWKCNEKINQIDESWFGLPHVFNKRGPHHTWRTKRPKIVFPSGRTWQDYVDRTCLEKNCGEASHLVSRYDAVYGNSIRKASRVGLLDRKMRVIRENARNREEWFNSVLRAFESTYGYELLGDSLFLARINLLWTFDDFCIQRWHRCADEEWCCRIAEVISWNIWQMDGRSCTVPFAPRNDTSVSRCKIRHWPSGQNLCYNEFATNPDTKFDVVVGKQPRLLDTDEYENS